MAEVKNAIDELECSICMDRLVSPQVLPCHHSYCKECLETILQFNNKGCAKLCCPNQCPELTNLEKDQTLDDVLKKMFALESFFNKMNSELHSEIVYCQQKHEEKILCSHYCQTCRKTSCRSCFEEHACEGNNYIKIAYDGQKESFQPICEEHQSYAKHICKECNNQHICVYCKHRRHRNHDCIDLDPYVERVKENLTADYQFARKFLLQLQQPDEELMKQFQEFKEKLSEELLVRRIIRVNRYITHLYEEESEILKQFDDRTYSFIQQKTKKLESFTEVERLMDNKTNIHTLAMISEQELLLQKLQDIVKELSLKFVLTDLTSDNHLGEISFEESNSHAFQNLSAKDNEMILSTDFRSIQKLQEEASLKMMNKYSSYAEIKDIKEMLDFKMAMAYTHERNTFEYLMAAVKENESKLLKMILEYANVEINMKDNCGKTVLIYASEKGHGECLKLLLEHGCNIDTTDNFGNTALIYASEYGHIECVKLLLEHSCSIDIKNHIGKTAAILASEKGHSECLKSLLDYNCNVDISNRYGNTALILASGHGHVECVKLLLKSNCNLDIQNNCGNTALIFSADRGHSECVKLLLEHNCNMNIKNNDGNTALVYALSHRHDYCVAMLKEVLKYKNKYC